MQYSLTVSKPRFFALLFATSLISMMFMVSPLSAQADIALNQCNGTDNVGGQAVECHYTITNNVNGTETSSTVTLIECHGAANDPATLVCTPGTTTSSTEIVTSVNQCNGSGNGGGGTVTCTVDVVNNITGTGTPAGATVNQCNASGTGGGTEPTVLCDPFPANTTGATVTQCNESGNGGGGTQRVRCTVDSDSTVSALLSVTVNQCNGSGNGGGATVTCRTGLTTNFLAPQPTPTATPTPTPTVPLPGVTPTPGPTVPGPGETPGPGGTEGPGSEGPNTGSGGPVDTSSNPGAPTAGGASTTGETTSQIVQIPVGGAAAGGGSTTGVENAELLLLGLSLMLIAAPVWVLRSRLATADRT